MGIGIVLATDVLAAPRTPSADSEVLERLPLRASSREAAAARRELATLRAAAQRDPGDAAAAVALAERYFDQALGQGDPRYVGYAEAVLNKVSGPPSAARLSMQGQLRQYRHDFNDALADFAAALKLDPDLAEAHAWRGAIFLVQADYAAARVECAALQRLQHPVLQAGCEALALAYTGQLDAAERTLTQALASARLRDSQLWLQTRLGEVAAWRGDVARAERHYRAALALGIDDSYLLAAWSDFLLDQGRPADVITLLTNWEAADPLLLRLTEAESLLKKPAAAAHIQALGERFAAAAQRGDTTHRAEESRYALRLRGDVKRAVQLARDNFTEQLEPRDARVLLEAALAANDSAAAQPALDWLARSGFQDTHLRPLALALRRPVAVPATSGSAMQATPGPAANTPFSTSAARSASASAKP
ncbi:MAG: tetratricopeptide repeat protein [Leptothrix sp. (in: b-proteobacteria)]